MIGWRESWWFRAIAALVVALLSGGFARVVFGLLLSAAEANRGAAAVAGAVLFGLGVRTAMRRFRNERPARKRHLRTVEEEPSVEDLERLFDQEPE